MQQFRIFSLAATLFALTAAGAPARAEDRDVRTLTVDYSDLNLASPSGIAALRHRLVIASRNVCGENEGHELAVRADMVACRDASMVKALADLRRVVASAQGTTSTTVASITP